VTASDTKYLQNIAEGGPFDPVEAIRVLAGIAAPATKTAPADASPSDDEQQAELLTAGQTTTKKRAKAELA
jgi:hypothetical protein